ncbi:MAG: L-alanine exporter AlaE [Devosiaceae bacterium]|nr:L-alanine exporter AlaE [Devosiaceae bacterium MH13]
MAHIFSLRTRTWLADNLALLSFFTLTGVLNERFVAGMEWNEVLRARLIGAPLMLLTARPYGIWRDWVMLRSGAVQSSKAKAFASDTLALLSFQVPIYSAIIGVSGASDATLVSGILGATTIMLLCGRPYGLWLDTVRKWMGAPTLGQPRPK